MRPLFLDIETCPDETRRHLFDLPEPPESLPAPADLLAGAVPMVAGWLKEYGPTLQVEWLLHLRDYEEANKARSGVFEAIKEARDSVARQRTELSVTPEFCRVTAMGWARGDQEPSGILADVPDTTGEIWSEADILSHFWTIAPTALPLIGFNILDFDLRVILVRSALLGIKPTRLFDTRPWGKDVIDLMKARFPAGKAMGLKRLARLYGLPVPVAEVDGSMVADLIRTDPQKVVEYVKSDVEVTRALYRLYAGYLCEEVSGYGR